MLSPEAQELIRRQRLKYLESLAEKRAAIRMSWRAVKGSEPAGGELASLKTVVHRLAGSAGSYGLDALGEIALQLDRLLAAPLAAQDPETIDRLVERLAAELDAAAHARR